ncbi:MAG TPA: DUF4037 domain-containing protein [Blastococcus sp.]|nr:DUF4037 domain-containing protein [Blastococcus sp.]
MCAARFLPAAELSSAFYRQAVAPLLAGRPHAAALLGWGSDVLGYDTERSTDHGWGPRLLVLLPDRGGVEPVEQLLDAGLPESVAGWPVRFGWDEVSPCHHVAVTTLADWLIDFLGVDASNAMGTRDWLLTPQQRLLGVVGGAVYADADGALAAVREALTWYPEQVWRWILACQWHRLAEEEAFVARTAEVGDATGSAVNAGRLVREMMRLALLLDRRYAPYSKWLGTAFAALPHRDGLPESLARALAATGAHEREAALADAWTVLGHRHNATGLTGVIPVTIGSYHSRPAQVLMADRFTEALLSTVRDPFLRALPPIGAVDQVTDNTEVLTQPTLYRCLAALYAESSSRS